MENIYVWLFLLVGIGSIVAGALAVMLKNVFNVQNLSDYTEVSFAKYSRISGICVVIGGVVIVLFCVLKIVNVEFAVSFLNTNAPFRVMIIMVLPSLIFKKSILVKKD